MLYSDLSAIGGGAFAPTYYTSLSKEDMDAAINRAAQEFADATVRQNNQQRLDITTVLAPTDSADIRRLQCEVLRLQRLVETDTTKEKNAFNLKDRVRH